MTHVATIIRMNRPESFRLRWERANDYINQGLLSEALQIFETLATEGYSEAYVEIANILEQGPNGEASQDLDAARAWYMKAIEAADDPFGYIGLARLALNGYSDAGTVLDAIEYLNIAAKSDNPIALTMLGTLYHGGRLVPKDLDKAADLYKKASAHGYILPVVYLAKVYWERGRYWSALRLRLGAVSTAYTLAKADRSDPRLWNYFS